MKDISIGDRTYRVVAVEHEGKWIAHAERADTGDRFGIECAGETQMSAIDRLARWLDWQHEHAAALEALQQAEGVPSDDRRERVCQSHRRANRHRAAEGVARTG